MTEAIYLDDSTVRTFEATVERVHDDRVVLDRTAFYPEGGGQPGDRGVLRADGREWRVEDVQKQDTIYHHLSTGDGDGNGNQNGDGNEPLDPPAEGTTVEGELDWERRHGHMRHHTAQHLLSAVLLEEFEAETTGNQVYRDRARIDCAYERFDDAEMDAIERRIQELVDDDRPVEWYELDRERAEAELDAERTRIHLLPESITEVRIVEIEGIDRTACAGTHVSSTGECGEIELTGRETKGSEEERLSFRLA